MKILSLFYLAPLGLAIRVLDVASCLCLGFFNLSLQRKCLLTGGSAQLANCTMIDYTHGLFDATFEDLHSTKPVS